MRRRTLLRVTGVSLATALAGCSDDADNDRKRTPPPTETVTAVSTTAAVQRTIRSLWDAYNDENSDAVVALFHPDSPMNITAENLAFRGTVTVDTVTITNQTADSASADATVTVSDGSQTITQNHTYDLRQHEGTWVIWTYDTDAGSATPTATQTTDSS